MKANSANMAVTAGVCTSTTQAEFLTNASNKSQLIVIITICLQNSGYEVLQAAVYADTSIVQMTIALSNIDKTIVLVGSDTDLLILLVAKCEAQNKVFMLHQGPGPKEDKWYNISKIQDKIGFLKDNLLFVHAMIDCDTTSAIYKHGKKKGLNVLKKTPKLANDMLVFNKPHQSTDQVPLAGEKFNLALYGGLQCESHSMRTYLQVQTWLGNELPPCNWGWQLRSEQLIPVTTQMAVALDELLNILTCSCKAGGCQVSCSCRQVEMQCSDMCKHCKGRTCCNAVLIESDSDSNEDKVKTSKF